MGLGQMMLTIAAMFLLSLVILTTNRGFLNTSATMYESRYDILGVSIANSIMEDALGIAFDERTINTKINDVELMTLVASLGIDDANENVSNPLTFDDFDDYNAYKTTPKVDSIKVIGSANSMVLQSFVRVDYVSVNDPNQIVNYRTYHKRMSIRSFAPGMTDTVRLSSVSSYWHFR